MDEQNVTAQAAPDEAAEAWEDDIIPVEDETPGEPAADAPPVEEGAPSGQDAADGGKPSGEADAPSEGAETPDEPDADAGKPSETAEPSQQELDYKALYEEQQEKANADKYRAVYNEQLGMTGNEAVARMVARNECGGKDYPLEDAPSAPGQSQTDFRAALAEIQSLYPDAAEMPTEVMRAFADGQNLTAAYAAHRAKRDAETIATLRRENDALKKAASNRAAAPVKGVNSAPPEKEDPLIQAFREEW